MNRDELKALGLTDEQVEAVMASHGKVFNPVKQNLDSVTTERDDLKGQIAERDTQLESLKSKAGDNEELLNQIEQLKTDNATKTADMQAKLDAQAFDFALDKTIMAAGGRNSKAIKVLLDNEIIKLADDGNLIGLSEQLTNLKESDGYLFTDEDNTPPPNPSYKPGSGQRGNDPKPPNDYEAARERAKALMKK